MILQILRSTRKSFAISPSPPPFYLETGMHIFYGRLSVGGDQRIFLQGRPLFHIEPVYTNLKRHSQTAQVTIPGDL